MNIVYTPGFVVSGKEWQGWFRGKSLSLEENAVGKLSIENDSFVSRFIPEAHTDRYPSLQLNIATLAMNKKPVSRQVKIASENDRKVLLCWIFSSILRMTLSTGSVFNFFGKMSGIQKTKALFALISAQDDLQPIQVTGG